MCPGQYVAELAIYMHVVTLLATCTIARPLDEAGEEYIPPIRFNGQGAVLCVSDTPLSAYSRPQATLYYLEQPNPSQSGSSPDLRPNRLLRIFRKVHAPVLIPHRHKWGRWPAVSIVAQLSPVF
jgi:hypothetical protein